VASKERPDWIWATFWWSPFHDGEFAAQRDEVLDAAGNPGLEVWRNYVMDVTHAGRAVECADGNKLDSDDPCYNPWLEAPLRNGRLSNCVSCHQYAAKGPRLQEGTVLFGFLPKDCNIFEGSVRLDYLWSLAPR